ncbi:hypothetical protein R1flu_012787 [Riccia fluitans]|uniref:O-methyltransferase n=1 Tax=Riccia fluitans TaxID=41844 RepID=A0ABD1ZCM5_9MARC
MQISLLVALPFAVKAVIRLGVPDIRNDAAPQVQLTADEIATRIAAPSGRAADPENLDRLLRLLASHNLLTTTVSGTERRYGLTPASGLKYLASNEGRSLASLLLFQTSPEFVSPFEFLHETVLDPSVEPLRRAYGVGTFEFLEKDRALGSLFNKAMAGSSALVMSSLLQEYKGFEGLNTLVDVGGGIGENLALILSKYPHLRGINFDLPYVVNKGLQIRDAKLINMDVLVVDTSLKSQSGFSIDVLMLTYLNGGRERNLSQFRKIAAAAGFSRVEIAVSVVNQTVLEFHKIDR